MILDNGLCDKCMCLEYLDCVVDEGHYPDRWLDKFLCRKKWKIVKKSPKKCRFYFRLLEIPTTMRWDTNCNYCDNFKCEKCEFKNPKEFKKFMYSFFKDRFTNPKEVFKKYCAEYNII